MKTHPVQTWGTTFLKQHDLSSTKSVLEVGYRDPYLSHFLTTTIPGIRMTTDQDNLTGHEGCFDAVISCSHLHWVTYFPQTIRAIYAALKPGGKAYLQFFAHHGRLKNDRFLYHTAQQSDWSHYFSYFAPRYSEMTLGYVSRVLSQTGFQLEHAGFRQHTVHFAHAEVLQTWLETWASHIERLPLRKRKTFLAQTVDHYVQAHQYAPDQDFPYPEYLLEIVCEKPVDPAPLLNPFALTPKEQTVLQWYLSGHSAKEIAQHMQTSVKTAEFHLANIRHKTHTHRRSDIFAIAQRMGLI